MKRIVSGLDEYLEIISGRAETGSGRGTNQLLLKETAEKLKKAISEDLNDIQRQTIYMYYYEGKRMSEIAEETGVCKSTVSRRIATARKILYKSLKFVL